MRETFVLWEERKGGGRKKMAERKSQQKYYPPEWTPDQGSVNKFRGHHPLGHRAKKIDQGIIVIRFEMPFNVWCDRCGEHAGKGVRFNAEKKCVGKYMSTRIFEFTMKCPQKGCSQRFVIRTDPEKTDYAVISGAKKKIEESDAAPEEAGMVGVEEEEEREKLRRDPLARLEKQTDDSEVGKRQSEHIEQIMAAQSAMRDDYAANAELRRKARKERKEVRKEKEDGKRIGLGRRLVRLTDEDRQEAELASTEMAKAAAVASAKETARRKEIEARNSSIFEPPPSKLRAIAMAAKIDPSLLKRSSPPSSTPPASPIFRT